MGGIFGSEVRGESPHPGLRSASADPPHRSQELAGGGMGMPMTLCLASSRSEWLSVMLYNSTTT